MEVYDRPEGVCFQHSNPVNYDREYYYETYVELCSGYWEGKTMPDSVNEQKSKTVTRTSESYLAYNGYGVIHTGDLDEAIQHAKTAPSGGYVEKVTTVETTSTVIVFQDEP